MNNARLIAAGCAAALAALSTVALAHDDDRGRFPRNATFTTHATTPLAIEGLTADDVGNVYTTGRATAPALCPVWRIPGPTLTMTTPTLTIVGFIPNPAACNPSGIAFDAAGDLYIADAAGAGTVWRLTPNATTPPTAEAFATGVPGTNGLAFDSDGNLWTGDGTTGQGRVWRIEGLGAVCVPTPNNLCMEVFRIQPMRNGVDLGGDIAGRGVGRENRTVPIENAQNLVANGLAFTPHGDLYVADTARGAIWKIEFDRRGNVKNRMNCDTTFTDKTLCLDSVFVAHPYLEGTDGIALDRAGNIWNSANERNAIVVVTKQRDVIEIFRNPVNAAGLRNSADPAVGNNHILEFPTSPVLVGRKFCTSQSDGNRRDNSPSTNSDPLVNINVGEIGGPGAPRGKISCMDQPLEIPGLRLPVH